MKVGMEFIQKNPNLDKPQFYLGLIAPDSVNVDGFAPKEKRWPAHLRDKDLDVWQKNVLVFFSENKGKYEELYLYGYVVHILTDIVCDRVYAEKVEPLLKEKRVEDIYGYYRNEIEEYENSQVVKNWWKTVVENLQNSVAEDINGIDKGEIERWKQYTIKNYLSRPSGNSWLITDDYVKEIANRVEKILD
jgi:hypothetical protein